MALVPGHEVARATEPGDVGRHLLLPGLMDFELILEALGDSGGSSASGVVPADLIRILARLDSLIEASGTTNRDELPSQVLTAWAMGDMVEQVAALQRSDPNLSIGEATTALRTSLGPTPLVTWIERRVDQLVEIRDASPGLEASSAE